MYLKQIKANKTKNISNGSSEGSKTWICSIITQHNIAAGLSESVYLPLGL